ncbi:hypothetical protein ACVWY3_004164 [Bradyrhizobium sp. USDA 4486]
MISVLLMSCRAAFDRQFFINRCTKRGVFSVIKRESAAAPPSNPSSDT